MDRQRNRLSKREMHELLAKWQVAWNAHDLRAVIELFDDQVEFEHWTGARVRGRQALLRAWTPWFQNHGGFRFDWQDLFVDEAEQKVLLQWQLEWPSDQAEYEGKRERRCGVDILHFRNGKIVRKDCYAKTCVEIGGDCAS